MGVVGVIGHGHVGVRLRDDRTTCMSAEPTASLDIALAHAARLLASDPALAAEQAREILRVVGDHPLALLVLGAALVRTAIESASMLVAVLRPRAAIDARQGLERIGHAALYLALPGWLLFRVFGA